MQREIVAVAAIVIAFALAIWGPAPRTTVDVEPEVADGAADTLPDALLTAHVSAAEGI